ncbi:hypothetical protein Tco_1292616 [Tanacetum coccineum]
MSNNNNNFPTQTSSVLHNDTVSSCLTSKVQEKTQLSRSRCMNSLREVKSQFKFLTETLQDFEFKERIQKYTRFNAQSFQDAMICNMDSIGKYMLEIILHQQRTPQLLKQKKLMQTQEDHSNLIPALNVDSSKVDLVVIQNTCSEKEDSNLETASSKSVKESSLDSATKDFSLDYDSQMTDKYFVEYTGIEVKHFRDTLLQQIGQHGQILNETSNKAKIKKEINVLEIMKIKLEHNVAKLRKENETLKKRYKDLYDSIKITRSNTIEQTTSLLANNGDLKARIQEMVFAIAALKNDLRKSKGNTVILNVLKPSVLE